MADNKTLKIVAKTWLKPASLLIKNGIGEWDTVAYMMAHSLECALKASICKTLHLTEYPARTKQEDYFFTHRFDTLLRLAGLEDIFGPKGAGFQVWSNFTVDFPGDWVAMRYVQGLFDEAKVKLLYKSLTDKTKGSEGILTILSKKQRW